MYRLATSTARLAIRFQSSWVMGHGKSSASDNRIVRYLSAGRARPKQCSYLLS